MSRTQDIYNQAKENGNVQEQTTFLKLGKKVFDNNDNFKGTKPTGKHIVKWLDDEEIKVEDNNTGQIVEKIQYSFEIVQCPDEVDKYGEGDEAVYRKKIWGDDGNLYYFVANMAQFEIGDTLSLEFIRKGPKQGFIKIGKIDEDVAEVDEENDEDVGVDDIPF